MLEAVIASDEEARRLHREVYNCAEAAYRVADDILCSVADLSDDLKRLHIAATWRDILRLAAWKADPKMGDLFVLLGNIGIKKEELLPFRNADISDLFPWLYYGKQFDALRKLCRMAKANTEKHLRNGDTRVYTHLVSEEAGRIVASSL